MDFDNLCGQTGNIPTLFIKHFKMMTAEHKLKIASINPTCRRKAIKRLIHL